MSERPVDYSDPPYWSEQGWTGAHDVSDYERELRRYAHALRHSVTVVTGLKELLSDGVAFLEMGDHEVGDDVWVWLHHANEALRGSEQAVRTGCNAALEEAARLVEVSCATSEAGEELATQIRALKKGAGQP